MKIFRPAKLASTKRNILITCAQTSVFWILFVGVAPYLILQVEEVLAMPPFHFPAQHPTSIVLGVLLGALNLQSGYAMATTGKGTPFPSATARELVIVGPYRYVRNPMAIGGLGAAFALGLYLGSILIVGYAFMGGIVWHLTARPMEERDLVERFGEPYENYIAAVSCWIPRLRAYKGSSQGPG